MTLGSLSRERWTVIEPLLDAALEMEPASRAVYLDQACRGDANVMPPLIEAVSAEATLQECCDVMRQVFGAYTEAAFV